MRSVGVRNGDGIVVCGISGDDKLAACLRNAALKRLGFEYIARLACIAVYLAIISGVREGCGRPPGKPGRNPGKPLGRLVGGFGGWAANSG